MGGRLGFVMSALCLACALLEPAARADGDRLAGSWTFVADSDGSKPKAKASIVLTFTGGDRGTLKVLATQPGQTLTDAGTYKVSGSVITLSFKDLDWSARKKPFRRAGCKLTLPFKAIGMTEGPGTSTWQRTDPPCVDAPAPEFSADLVIVTGTQRRRARLHVGARAVRVESSDGVRILRLDRQTLYALPPGGGPPTETYLPVPDSMAFLAGGKLPGGCRVVGQETIAGHACEKRECTSRFGSTKLVERTWVATDLGGITLKSTDGESTVQLENIKLGPQDAELFEVPAAAATTTTTDLE